MTITGMENISKNNFKNIYRSHLNSVVWGVRCAGSGSDSEILSRSGTEGVRSVTGRSALLGHVRSSHRCNRGPNILGLRECYVYIVVNIDPHI